MPFNHCKHACTMHAQWYMENRSAGISSRSSPKEGQHDGHKGDNHNIDRTVEEAHGEAIADATHDHLGLNHIEHLHIPKMLVIPWQLTCNS